MRVLLVEDDVMIAEGLIAALGAEGMSVDWVRDGAAAETALLDAGFAIVLLDLGLPASEGLELLKSARSQGVDTPVLIITARGGVDDRVSGLVAQKSFDRPINGASFEEWVETRLAPALSKGDIVIMDNLSSHKGPRVEQLIAATGAELRYLPPYSPVMNPIEKAYSKLTAFSRKLADRTAAGLLAALDACADIFRPANAKTTLAPVDAIRIVKLTQLDRIPL
jgi:transposase